MHSCIVCTRSYSDRKTHSMYSDARCVTIYMATQGPLILFSFYDKQCAITEKITPILANREYR